MAVLKAVDLGEELRPVSLSLGARHSCALFEHGAVKCWGDNSFGQLGLGDTEARGDEPEEMGARLPFLDFAGDSPVAIAAGTNITCAALVSGAVACWGERLHLGESGDALSPLDRRPIAIGEAPLELTAGSRHACVRTADGQLSCWGSSAAGQAGSPEASGAARRVELGAGLEALFVSAGSDHTCALFGEGLKCWGLNLFGALGLGTTEKARGDSADEVSALPYVNLGQLNEVPLRVLDVGVGTHFGCAVLEGRRIRCWGVNESGQLGAGHREPRGERVEDLGNALELVPGGW
jgi:alpha-tubulin suppressor-like RCC1 family protein